MMRLKMILLTLFALFFLAFGIHLLISAYQLNDPFSFILTFFASNLIILISAVLGLGFVIKLRRASSAKADRQHKPTPTL